MYIKNPARIEYNSMDIIEEYLGDVNFSEEELPIVKRMIHTTGDVDYRKIIEFKHDFVTKAINALKSGGKIYVDTNMICSGVNKEALRQANIEVVTYISDENVRKIAAEKGITRSIVGIDKAVNEGMTMFAFGNAPTALFKLIEHIKNGDIDPKFVIGVPVGFVGAAESKRELDTVDVPWVRTNGSKGGSNVAVSIINALLYNFTQRSGF
ncbi:MAG: precorrin-8X methylmutase [Ezakiella sp.]|nr:precorrin-8X methylmutase [Ezakiella sp.]MDD7471452.1 precorrin-8X methylmutase [Bacillota bacterium]MDY3922846.1 precorrin-8X methylmutase [Ezakiella sp.]